MLSSYNYSNDDSSKTLKMSKINDATLLYKVNLNSEYDENEEEIKYSDNDDKLPLINNKQDTVIDENKQIEVTALNEKLNEKKNEDVSSSTQGLSVPLSLNSSVLLNNKIESSVSGIDAVINENIPIVSYATSSNGNINNKEIDGISTWENIDINNTKNSEMEIGKILYL